MQRRGIDFADRGSARIRDYVRARTPPCPSLRVGGGRLVAGHFFVFALLGSPSAPMYVRRWGDAMRGHDACRCGGCR